MGMISLEGMVFYAHHGYYQTEQERGNKFVVDLHITADLMPAAESDTLTDTINYETVYQLVEKEMKTCSKLLEHIAFRIIQQIKIHFPQAVAVEVKVSKLNPPVKGMVDIVSVTIKK